MPNTLTIPETPAEMQEILNTPAKAAEWIKEGQLSDIITAYAKATQPDLAEQMREQLTAFYEGNSVVENTVETALNKVLAERGVPTTRPDLRTSADGMHGAAYNTEAPGVRMEEVGFANLGDFARVVYNKGRPGDERMQKAIEVMNAYSSVDPSTGGFLIPETFRSEIYDLVLEQAVVRPRSSVISMSTPSQSIPFIDETTHSGSLFGGISFSRVQEATAVSNTQAAFGRVRLTATKLMGTASVPNELWADAPSLSTWLMAALPRAIAHAEDLDFLVGDGGNEPLGVLNSGAIISVSQETGQSASTIITDNVLKIMARVLPQSMNSGVWVANPTCLPQLNKLTIAVGTGGSSVSLMDIRSDGIQTLMGRPLVYTEKVPALGSAGCLSFVDFGFYLIGDRQSVSVDTSEHAGFTTDSTLLRAILRNDGRPWIQSALTPVNGDTLSPFVQLAAVT